MAKTVISASPHQTSDIWWTKSKPSSRIHPSVSQTCPPLSPFCLKMLISPKTVPQGSTLPLPSNISSSSPLPPWPRWSAAWWRDQIATAPRSVRMYLSLLLALQAAFACGIASWCHVFFLRLLLGWPHLACGGYSARFELLGTRYRTPGQDRAVTYRFCW